MIEPSEIIIKSAETPLYLSLEEIAQRTSMPLSQLKARMQEKHMMDSQEQPIGSALITAITRYRFYQEKEGRIDGEWLWREDIVKEL